MFKQAEALDDGGRSPHVPGGTSRLTDIVGRGRRMRDLLDLAESVAASDANILIQGENGTGKELIANAIHALSHRAAGPYIKINCAAIPKDLIESELFGYKKGAFTGASADKQGLLEAAEGGSLLLDEIGEMPSYLQTKLLRVLQDRAYRPVGSDGVVHVDFRLICATNVNLDTALREGRLREDLYFRINTITLAVPSLRDRLEDIPVLCEHFLEKYCERHGREVRGLDAEAARALTRYHWPGNVRQLENVIERGVLVARSPEITLADLPEDFRDLDGRPVRLEVPPNTTLAELERAAIVQTLDRTHGNKQEAARILGLYRPTLYSKMRKHGIEDRWRGKPRGEAGGGGSGAN